MVDISLQIASGHDKGFKAQAVDWGLRVRVCVCVRVWERERERVVGAGGCRLPYGAFVRDVHKLS